MNKVITFKTLEQLLLHLGFIAGDTPGGQPVFHHRPTDTILAFSPYAPDDRVQAHHLMITRRMLTERGVIEDGAFDRLLDEAREPAPLLSD